MRKLHKKIAALLSACTMLISSLGTLPVSAADSSDDLKQYNIEITHNGQVVDSFMGMDAVYNTYYQWSGPFSCAGFVGDFYEKFYDGMIMYDINSYQGKPHIYYPGHKGELIETNYPVPGDVVQDFKYSHVAIVKAVDGDILTLIEQNWKWTDQDGKVICTVNRKVNKNNVHVYRLFLDGKDSRIPYDMPSVSTAAVTNVSSKGFTVTASAFSEKSPLTAIRVGTYPSHRGMSGITWTTLTAAGNNIPVSSYYQITDPAEMSDTYITLVEAVNKNGSSSYTRLETYVDRTSPVITDLKVSNITAEGYKVSCQVSDNNGVVAVKYPSWTTANGTDDIPYNWEGNIYSNGTLYNGYSEYTVLTAYHNSEYGEYNTTVYAYDAAGNVAKADIKAVINPAAAVTLDKTEITIEAGSSEKLNPELESSGKGKVTDELTWTSSDDSTVSVIGGKISADEVGKATVEVETSAGKTAVCEITVTKNVEKLTVDRLADEIYSGMEITPALNVWDGSKLLSEGVDYTVSYSGNKELGKATVKLTGKGFYKGSRSLSFNIIPAPASGLVSTENTSESISLSWDESPLADGYIVYSQQKGETKELARVSSAEFKAEGLSAASEQSFRVAAYIKQGDKEFISESASLTTATAAKRTEGLSADRCGNCLSIFWDKQQGVTGYEARLTDKDGQEQIIAIGTPSVLSCCFLTGINGEHSISIRAYKEVSGARFYGEWSEEIAV